MQNNVPMGMLWNRVLTEGDDMDCAQGQYPNLTKSWRPVACQHCENSPCVKACPVGATYKAADGRVLVDYERCIGCRYCMAACPYNVRVFNWQKPVRQPDFNYGDALSRPLGVAEKCSMCKERTDKGLIPMCVVACPAKARKFGDLGDPNSEVSQLIRKKDASQLLQQLGTKPQVYYLR
jgi:molybdopterin-containing oxidoreductase family iron-sulfur binding subunit